MNLPTFIILLILIAVTGLVVRRMILDKKAGKGCCGCSGGCGCSRGCSGGFGEGFSEGCGTHSENSSHKKEEQLPKV